jgi:hypothetical protein
MDESVPQVNDPGLAIGGKAPPTQQADPLAPVALVSYAHGDHAERHRRIMRVFCLNKTRDIGLQLSPSQVADRLRSEFGYSLDADRSTSALERLSKNGALRADQDIRDVRSAPEFRRKSMLYDITPAGELFEEFLIALDGLRDEIGGLPPPGRRATLCSATATRTMTSSSSWRARWPSSSGRDGGARAWRNVTRTTLVPMVTPWS